MRVRKKDGPQRAEDIQQETILANFNNYAPIMVTKYVTFPGNFYVMYLYFPKELKFKQIML